MAYPIYDPQSTEALSSPIAGISEGIIKIFQVLNLEISLHEDITLENLYIDEQTKNTIYQSPTNLKLWDTSYNPIIKINNIITNPSTGNFVIDYTGGMIRFVNNIQLADTDIVKATFKSISNQSAVLKSILETLTELQLKADKNKGYFATEQDLKTAYPTAEVGDNAIVGETDTVWIWDDSKGEWLDTHKGIDLTNYWTIQQTEQAIQSSVSNVVKFTQQELAEPQKSQARTNIGAVDFITVQNITNELGDTVKSATIGGIPVPKENQNLVFPSYPAQYVHPATHPASIIVQDASNRFMTDAERTKLEGIADGANKYVHPATHPASIIQQNASNRFMTDGEREKLSGIAERANKYVHPDTHPASIIVQDASNRFMTDAERTKLEGIADGANKYVHPATHPASIIVQDASNRFMTDAERTKLEGIADGANKYVHPSTHPASIIEQDANNRLVTDEEISSWNNKANKSTQVTATLLANSWAGTTSPYTYTLSVSGVTATSNQDILPSQTITIEQMEMLQGANIVDGGQSANTITLKAFGEKPTIDIPIRIIKRGDT